MARRPYQENQQSIKRDWWGGYRIPACSHELDGLQKVLRILQTIEPSADNIDHVHAMQAMALACQIPLRQFLQKIESFEPSMGPFSTIGSIRSSPRKAQWALHMSQETEKLRALVGAKVMSINLLLSTYTA